MKRILLAIFVLTLAPLANVVASEGDVSPYYLANPSFEQARSDGGAAGWSGESSAFVIASEDARTGNTCLKWTGDGTRYNLCSQTTKLRPGDWIDFSVWVKTKDLKGGAATVCVEWNRPDGTWYGGAYAHGMKGTTDDWEKVSARTKIPDDAANPRIIVYVTESGSGTAWFDDVEIAQYEPPFFSAIMTNRYRSQSTGGPVDVFVCYTKTTNKVDFKELEPELEIVGNDGSKASAALVEAADDYYRFSFDSTELSVGKYTLTCSMDDPLSQKPQTVSTPFTKLDEYPARVSYIDEHQRLIRNGEPFFPLGLYLSAASPEQIEILGDSPFNCVMPYAPISRSAVDSLFENGIHTIYSVKDNFPGLQNQTMEEGNARTERMINELKDCPGVIAWYINDELPATMVDDLSARRDQVEALDPSRPAWVVLYQVNELRSYLSTFDVIGTDPYPISDKEPSVAAEWTEKTVNAVFGKRAVWQVPQIFNWASYKSGDKEKAKYRAPTFEEMRGMAWMCVANGANGLIFYSFFDLFKMDKTVDEGGYALVREPFDKRWGEVKTMAQEIEEQFPILLAAGETLDIAPTEASSDEAIYRLYGTDEGTWLLVVNKSREPQQAEFAVPEGAKVVETRLGSEAAQDGNTICVDLGALEPRLILIK